MPHGSLLIRRWREPDSNCRSLAERPALLGSGRVRKKASSGSSPIPMMRWRDSPCAMNSAPASLAPLLSSKRTAREAGEDPPDNEHRPCGNADEGGSDQQRHPGQSQNSDEQRKEGDADGSQPRNRDASTWCGPVDTQIREARGQSAPGGMISGSV